MRKLYIVLGVVVLLLAGVALYVVLNPGVQDQFRAKTVIDDPKQLAKSVLVYVRNPYKDDYDISRIPGYIDNMTQGKITSADIEIHLLDSDGNRKETVKYTITEVAPRSRKSFDANAGALAGPRKAEVVVKRIEVMQ